MSQCICGRGLTRAFEVQSQGTLQGSEKKSTASRRLGIKGQKMNLTLYFMLVSLFSYAAKLPVYIYTHTQWLFSGNSKVARLEFLRAIKTDENYPK